MLVVGWSWLQGCFL